MEIEHHPTGWSLLLSGQPLISHSPEQPCCYVGHGQADVAMKRGHFEIRDYVEERVPLRHAAVAATPDGSIHVSLSRSAATPPELQFHVRASADGAVIEFDSPATGPNRLWWRVRAVPEEHVWGGGEQMSYFDLRGRNFPLWTQEPGVGRDKTTHITWQADVAGRGGGDYHTTYFPQPTYLSSRRYALHADTTAYADFDFRHAEFHELHFWAVPAKLELFAASTYLGIVEHLSARFGRQPELPDWVYRGAILGLKRGREHADRVLALSAAHGMPVAALWCEDWAGIRVTSFGTRLFWDWHWNEQQYPQPHAWVESLHARGIRFLGYINPYLCNDGVLYREARAGGYLVKDAAGEDYTVDFGEFLAGLVDFTNPAAARWYGERVIGREMIAAGLDGWMADFGEYLPTDARLHDGTDAMLAHNAWPTLWAKVNGDAVRAAGRRGDIVFFMRAGYTGAQAHSPMLWAGDQCVDFSRHDGLQTVICAALSSGLLGNAFHHSDIGGYTSLFGNIRTPEVFQRWAEMAAFTPFMRTHEGNRPKENFQFWEDEATLAHFARMAKIFVALAPYTRRLAREAATRGVPLQRALFLHFEHDPACYAIQDQYLYGENLLVAPVHAAGHTTWEPYLPAGAEWIHLWSGHRWPGGQRVKVAAPIGQPPVFVRAHTPDEAALLALSDI